LSNVSEEGFEENTELFGVLPTEEANGTFENRQTRLSTCPCGCGQDSAVYTDDDEVCYVQTSALRAKANDVPYEVYLDAVEAAQMGNVMDAIFEKIFGGLGEPDALIFGFGADGQVNGLVIGILTETSEDDDEEVYGEEMNFPDFWKPDFGLLSDTPEDYEAPNFPDFFDSEEE